MSADSFKAWLHRELADAAERRDTEEAYRFLAELERRNARGDHDDDAPTLRLRRSQRVCQTD